MRATSGHCDNYFIHFPQSHRIDMDKHIQTIQFEISRQYPIVRCEVPFGICCERGEEGILIFFYSLNFFNECIDCSFV